MESAMSTALWERSGSNNTADMSVLSSTNQMNIGVSRVVYSFTNLVTTTPEATVSNSENLTSFRVQGSHETATPFVLSAAEANTVLKRILVAAQALVLLSIFLFSSLAILCLPFSFVMLFSKDGVWMFGQRFCMANGFFNSCFGIISTLTMTLISFDRYYAIVRQPRAKIGRQKATKLLIAVWLIAIVFSLPWYVLMRKSTQVHKQGFYHCTYVFHSGTSRLGTTYSISLIIVCFLLPFALMCFCHYNICKTVRLSELRVRPVTTYAYLLQFYSEMRTATTVLIMIVFIIFCWGPYCLMGLVTALGDYTFNPAMDTFAIWLAWTNGAINPLIYALRNPNLSILLGRSREEGYRTRCIVAYLSNHTQNREIRLNQVERIRDRYLSRVGVNNCKLSNSSPGKRTEAEGTMWACKNPAVFFCRDTQSETKTTVPTHADTSL
ncbi:G-protein coupled receptor 135 isoform X2 [Hippocampus zosterae]|uniref:G-protein coupled receptor 135 isoform X2 n=1 Tax=Hippocampus zosterae TaxID=109293 RepID=UPI00223D92CF|nr:G-protein coupled receptor 135 isoform X2 [Hippocampus zosterae]